MGYVSPFTDRYFPPPQHLTDGAAISHRFLQTVLPTTIPTPPQQGFGAAPIPPLGRTDAFTANYAPEIYAIALQTQSISVLLLGGGFSGYGGHEG
jgi:hypothetical protein